MTQTPAHSFQSKPRLVRFILARPRLLSCFILGVLTVLLLPKSLEMRPITKAIIGWNVGACLYLLLAGHMMFRATHEVMKMRALREDEGRLLVLTFVVIAALTIVSSWAFTQVIFFTLPS